MQKKAGKATLLCTAIALGFFCIMNVMAAASLLTPQHAEITGPMRGVAGAANVAQAILFFVALCQIKIEE